MRLNSLPLQILLFHSIAVINAQVSNAVFLLKKGYVHKNYSMSKLLMSKVARRSQHHGAVYMLAIQQRRDFSAVRERPMLESVKTLAPLGVSLTSTASISELPPQATPQYVPLTALGLFLAENPGLKPFLLAGPARDIAVNEAAIAWSEICDHVFRLTYGQICAWHTGISGTLRSRMAQWSGVKEVSNSKRSVEIDSLIDENYNTRSSQDEFATFDSPPSFSREFMPFFFVFGERIQEKSGHEIDLDDLRIKAEDEMVSTAFCLCPYFTIFAI